MIILDSNVVIALLVPSDRHHRRAQDGLGSVREPVALAYGVLLEVGRVLRRTTRDSRFAAETVNRLADEFTLVFESEPIVRNALARYRQDHGVLSLVDCELIEWKKTAGFDVLTFDEALEKKLL